MSSPCHLLESGMHDHAFPDVCTTPGATAHPAASARLIGTGPAWIGH
ncbi:hypothetical protein STRIP9103_08675 [Streptomyces ipomoeae 91-03]|uniref:Uncharacterized protein n=1 Tax=Streptomyces ipomoeae 91-03 TaxID=698759 RepID=L1KP75_9ACTN|nr:hypothetical protein STRIP9103_08675 [Streptomyces ipomoeae 91-03]